MHAGHVKEITLTEIVLEEGTAPTSASTLHVDCTANGLQERPVLPVWHEDGRHIVLQSVSMCQQVFSAAVLAQIESLHGCGNCLL